MKNILPGYKTKITTIILALIPLLGLMGIRIDPDIAIKFIGEFSVWIETGVVLVGALGVYFRGLANS